VRIEDGCKVFLTNHADKKAPEKQFVYDSAYDGASTNDTIYGDICYNLVESVLEGYNSTIFAYGQTGNLYVTMTNKHYIFNDLFDKKVVEKVIQCKDQHYQNLSMDMILKLIKHLKIME
jgi:hypothetical protein